MSKRRPSFNPSQLDLAFGVPERASSDGALRDLARFAASAVAQVLREDPRSRFDIAAAVSQLLDEDVSKLMLDAYASEARTDHRISFDRMLALVAATGRYDVLRQLLHLIGADVLVGEEVYLAEIGHLESKKRDIDTQLRRLKSAAKPMERGGSRR